MAKIYLASPYSHPDPAVMEKRFISVCKAAARLMREGHIVFSPIAHSHPIAHLGGIDPTHGFDWLAQDLALMPIFDELYVLALPGWSDSLGVQAEIAEARRLDIPVFFKAPNEKIWDTFGED